MKPQEYLSDLGIKYFREIEKILHSRGLDKDEYSIELSILADQYSKHQDANEKAAEREKEGKPGFYNQFDNGTLQINGYFTMIKESLAVILKLSPKFGLTPADLDKLKNIVGEPKKKSKLQKLMEK
tara:strand:+ start:624 stop:1001 length:378 start_codon:yes stop_codon:yes gene_type:complete